MKMIITENEITLVDWVGRRKTLTFVEGEPTCDLCWFRHKDCKNVPCTSVSRDDEKSGWYTDKKQ